MLVVDDHAAYRQGLRLLLEAEGLDVVGEATTGEEGTRLARELAPEVVLMDMDMPGAGGLEAATRISQHAPSISVVIVSGSAEESETHEAIQAGAHAVLTKDRPLGELVAAIRAAAAGA